MTEERKHQGDTPKDAERARDAAENPMRAASQPASGKERRMGRRMTAPIVFGVVAAVVLLIIVLI